MSLPVKKCIFTDLTHSSNVKVTSLLRVKWSQFLCEKIKSNVGASKISLTHILIVVFPQIFGITYIYWIQSIRIKYDSYKTFI